MIDLAAIGVSSFSNPVIVLTLLAALAALLALDETSYAQTWLSQPLPAGILAGLVGGDPVTGLAAGGAFQLATLGNPPVGQIFTGDRTTAVVAGVGGAILAKQTLALPAATSSGAASLGWLLVALSMFSLLGHFVLKLERRANLAWMLAGHRSLRDGRLGRFDRLHAACLGQTAFRGALLCLVWVGVMTQLWWPLFARLPQRQLDALAWLPLMVVPLGVAALIELHGWRTAWKWIGLGSAAWLAATGVAG